MTRRQHDEQHLAIETSRTRNRVEFNDADGAYFYALYAAHFADYMIGKDDKRSVDIYDREYVIANGKLPRGVGSWAFCEPRFARRADYLAFVFWQHGVTYRDAKRNASRFFAKQGVSFVLLLS